MALIAKIVKESINRTFISPVRFKIRVTKIFANPAAFFPYAVHRRNSIINTLPEICKG